MRKSLFALENDDSMNNAPEMEVSGEEGEAAAALTETGDDAGEISEVAEAVSEGTEAADQMGQVEELVEDAVENGEGLDPVAAEAVRISVEAICARIGANPRAVYSLYATENFQSASSRKANSRIALEGVGEFLKNLYEKIKAALSNMWTKIKAFWAKHISTLGRVKKALEAMKAKVASSSGKFNGRAVIDEAPSSMVDSFVGTGSISVSSVTNYVKSHATLSDSFTKVKTILDATGNYTAPTAAAATNPPSKMVAALTSSLNSFNLGENNTPLINGVWIKYELDKDEENDKVTVTVERNTIDNKDTKRSMTLADKGEVKTVLDATLTVINTTIKSKDQADKNQSAVEKTLQTIGSAINGVEKGTPGTGGAAGTPGDPEYVKTLRKELSMMYSIHSKLAPVSIEIVSQNIRLAKAVLGFSAICLKNYK